MKRFPSDAGRGGNGTASLTALAALAAMAAMAALLAAPAAQGQSLGGGSYQLTGQVTGGGGVVGGGSLLLAGGVLPAVSGTSKGGNYQVVGGLVGPIVVETAGGPRMSVQFTADKLALLSWLDDGNTYILEFSPSVGPGEDWQPTPLQPTGSSFLTPCQQPARFFRLRRK